MNFLLNLFKSPPLMPIDYQEAFPDAETLFCKAFGLPDPTPELLNLIKAHPTEAKRPFDRIYRKSPLVHMH